MLTCDCGAKTDQDNGPVTHEPNCIHWQLEPDDASDHYGL